MALSLAVAVAGRAQGGDAPAAPAAADPGWPRTFSFSRRETTRPIDSRSCVMFATVCGLNETLSTISLRDTEPARRMTSSTMRRLKGALDCCEVPRLTMGSS